jgi:hypothetical protein
VLRPDDDGRLHSRFTMTGREWRRWITVDGKRIEWIDYDLKTAHLALLIKDMDEYANKHPEIAKREGFCRGQDTVLYQCMRLRSESDQGKFRDIYKHVGTIVDYDTDAKKLRTERMTFDEWFRYVSEGLELGLAPITVERDDTKVILQRWINCHLKSHGELNEDEEGARDRTGGNDAVMMVGELFPLATNYIRYIKRNGNKKGMAARHRWIRKGKNHTALGSRLTEREGYIFHNLVARALFAEGIRDWIIIHDGIMIAKKDIKRAKPIIDEIVTREVGDWGVMGEKNLK